MGLSHNSRGASWASSPKSWLAVVSACVAGSLAIWVLSGCSSAGKGTVGGSDRTALLSAPNRDLPGVLELARVRRAALGFAHSYVEAIGSPARAALRDSTPALRRELHALRARLPNADRAPKPRLLALALAPRSQTRVDATITLHNKREPPFPISFVLRLIGSRWLITRLPGN